MIKRLYRRFSRLFYRFSRIGRFDFSLSEPLIDTTKEKVLDLGCGSAKMPGSIGIDIVKLEDVDIVYDLNKIPWKGIEDSSYDWILMKDILEHLDNTIDIMRECYRILKPGGKLYIRVTYWNHSNTFSDPTHKQFFTEVTFKFFTGEKRPYYMDFHYKDLHIDYAFDPRAVKKFGTNRKKLFKKSYFYCNVISGMHVILTK